jgi:hypothetical protein
VSYFECILIRKPVIWTVCSLSDRTGSSVLLFWQKSYLISFQKLFSELSIWTAFYFNYRVSVGRRYIDLRTTHLSYRDFLSRHSLECLNFLERQTTSRSALCVVWLYAIVSSYTLAVIDRATIDWLNLSGGDLNCRRCLTSNEKCQKCIVIVKFENIEC